MNQLADEAWRHEPVAVLASGGLDSAVLLDELARSAPRVAPLYVRFGLVWESAEEASLRQYLGALAHPVVEPLRVFAQPIADVYADHWSTRGIDPPDARSSDDAVYLPGRNLLLLAQTGLWCHLNRVPTLALGTLRGNPFPDADESFFGQYQALLNRAVGGSLRIVRPYRGLSKLDVIRRGKELPLAATFSCIAPVDGLHCGRCNKCAERGRAFAAASLVDPTRYASGLSGVASVEWFAAPYAK
jgi:7-cyano-7-deazaguanine synthase